MVVGGGGGGGWGWVVAVVVCFSVVTMRGEQITKATRAERQRIVARGLLSTSAIPELSRFGWGSKWGHYYGGGYSSRWGEQIRKTQDEPQWIVAQGLLSALTIPGFS